jgi:hypothetical protein
MKQADLRDMFKKASKSICTLTTVASPDALPPTPSTSSAMKSPESTEEDPDDPDCLVIQHLYGPIAAGLMEFYCVKIQIIMLCHFVTF